MKLTRHLVPRDFKVTKHRIMMNADGMRQLKNASAFSSKECSVSQVIIPQCSTSWCHKVYTMSACGILGCHKMLVKHSIPQNSILRWHNALKVYTLSGGSYHSYYYYYSLGHYVRSCQRIKALEDEADKKQSIPFKNTIIQNGLKDWVSHSYRTANSR